MYKLRNQPLAQVLLYQRCLSPHSHPVNETLTFLRCRHVHDKARRYQQSQILKPEPHCESLFWKVVDKKELLTLESPAVQQRKGRKTSRTKCHSIINSPFLFYDYCQLMLFFPFQEDINWRKRLLTFCKTAIFSQTLFQNFESLPLTKARYTLYKNVRKGILEINTSIFLMLPTPVVNLRFGGFYWFSLSNSSVLDSVSPPVKLC